MSAFRKRSGALLLYLVAIVGPVLVLLYLGLQSVERQRQALETMRAINLRLMAERLANDLSGQLERLASDCLRDPELSDLTIASFGSESPESRQRLRRRFERVIARHPVADLLVVTNRDQVRYPRLDEPPPDRLEEYLEREPRELRERFAALFAEAQRLESETRRPADAVSAYQRTAEVPVSGVLRATALARAARSATKANQPDRARSAYAVLRDQYGDTYDAFHRPFGLTAGLELVDLEGGRGAAAPGAAALARDLLGGRWELTAQQFDYYRDRLASVLDGRTQDLTSEYAHDMELTRTLHELFRAPATPGAHGLSAYYSPDSARPFLTYTVPVREPAGDVRLAVAVDLRWIQRELLPRIAAALDVNPQSVALIPADTSSREQDSVATVFPFWRLAVTPDAAASSRRDTYTLAGATAATLAVLMLGLVLLLRDASRQMQVGRMRTDFVSGVSHELKTPLTLIRLYAETLAGSDDVAAEERREYSGIVVRESERLTQLIDRVLDFSRIERGERTYELREGDLSAVVGRTIGAYAQFLRRRGYRVDVELPERLPSVAFDQDAVAAALVNLLDNAAKYSADVKSIAVRMRTDGAWVIFEIEDHGIGIPAAEQEKVFDKFYRSAAAASTGGYGLGLFLVKHVMVGHHGGVEVDSVVGRGSVFRLKFPVRDGS